MGTGRRRIVLLHRIRPHQRLHRTGAGETYSAIVGILAITVRARHSLPAKLVTQLSTWLDSYAGDVNEPTIRSLLNGVGLRPRLR